MSSETDTPTQDYSQAPEGRTEAVREAAASGGGDLAALHREAAKYRRERNEMQPSATRFASRIDGLHRVEVERMAAERFTDPRDVWAVTSLDQLRGEDGLVDLEMVGAEFARIEQDRPHWKKPPSKFPIDLHAGVRTEAPEPPSMGGRDEAGRARKLTPPAALA